MFHRTYDEGADSEFQCQVAFVSPGKSVTEFRLRVGSEYYTGGDKTETLENNNITYTVTCTHRVQINRSHHGKPVQCEVTWMYNTPVETVRNSSTQTLNVYCELLSFTVCIFPHKSIVFGVCSSKKNSRFNRKYIKCIHNVIHNIDC